jgi:hypothetical protein
MRRNRDRIDSQQTDSLRIAHPDGFGVGQFDFRESQTLAQNAAFLFGRPLHCEWKKLFQLIAGCLSIHVLWESRNLAESEKIRLPERLQFRSNQTVYVQRDIRADWRGNHSRLALNRAILIPFNRAKNARPYGP